MNQPKSGEKMVGPDPGQDFAICFGWTGPGSGQNFFFSFAPGRAEILIFISARASKTGPYRPLFYSEMPKYETHSTL